MDEELVLNDADFDCAEENLDWTEELEILEEMDWE